jgi:AcrR family transcriptional regulator
VTAQRAARSSKAADGPKGLLNQARWAEIVAAAAEVFHENGYRAATLQEVASRVGLLKGSLYYYIESKEDLLFAVVQAEYERGLATLEEDEATARAEPPVRLARFIHRWMDVTLATLPQRTSVLISETRHLGPERLDTITRQRQRIHDFVRVLVSAGVASGDFDASVHPGVATNVLFSMMDGTQQWYRASGSLSVPELTDWLVSFVLHGLAAGSLDVPVPTSAPTGVAASANR